MTVGHKGLELQVKKELEDKSDVDALPQFRHNSRLF
jgi:hypothetical protein